MQRTLIIYESKYGCTREVAKNLSYILGPSCYCTVDEFKDEYKNFDFFVIGTPIYFENVEQKIINFLSDNKGWLIKKRVVIFCTCIYQNCKRYLLSIKQILDNNVIDTKAIGGRLNINILDMHDYTMMKSFCKKTGMPFRSINLYSLEEVVNYGLKLKNIKESFLERMPRDELINYVDDFLNSHNTCTLSTSYNGRVRSTPIEYIYNNSTMYFLSEGGQKFSNILLNSKVSISVYEPFTVMEKLAGMQITGKASIIQRNTDEYREVLKLKNIDEDKVFSLHVLMNLIKVEVKKVEFLYYKFKDLGYNVKQICQVTYEK